MMRFTLLLLTLMVLSVEISAQEIKGKLLDATTNRPLRHASLNLTSLKDSTRIFNSVSDSSGNFEFKDLYKDSFILKISFVGYEDFKQIVSLKNAEVDLGSLLIPKSIKQLAGVTV
ncbi:MAG TPA: carboxypeptidase-like regulatory domain-containing protein, partial [Chitinophagaceae bacterium]